MTDISKEGTGILAVRDSTVALLKRNDYVVKRNTESLNQEQSLLRIGDGGSNLNWVIGHMTAARNSCLKLLGAEPLWDKAQSGRYDRGSQAADIVDAELLADLLEALFETGTRLKGALSTADAVTLERPNPRDATETVMDAAGFWIWHDTYHAGQTALYRRIAGLSGVL